MTGSHPNVVFMGTPDFAVASLDALEASGRYRPALVVSQPDRPRGRGRRTVPTPVRARAMELGIETREMSKDNYAAVVSEIAALTPDVVVVVAFGIIIKRDLLELPRLGCVNVHASLLPRHRGVSPIQAAILAGDTETGCTTMHIDEGIDTGDILLCERTDILPTDTAGSLSERLAALGGGLLVRTLDGLFEGSVTPVPQGETPTPYTKKIRKRHGEIDWSKDAVSLWRRVRAMTPWPSAFTFIDGARVIVTAAEPVADCRGEPGALVSLDPFRVACAEGCLEIIGLRPEGKKSMSPNAFLAGHRLRKGQRLGGDGV